MINFVSYNIQYGTGLDGRVDLDRIIEEIDGADIICLQEVEAHWRRTGMVNQAAEIAARLHDYYVAYGPGLDVDASFRGDDGRVVNRRRQFGNMVLARWPLSVVRNHLLPKLHLNWPLSLQRAALETVIEVPERRLRTISTHFAHVGGDERLRQAEALLHIIGHGARDGGAWSGRQFAAGWHDDGGPVTMPTATVVMGDFNMTDDSPEYGLLCGDIHPIHGPLSTGDGLSDAWLVAGNNRALNTSTAPDGGATWGAEDDAKRIDLALVTSDLVEHIEKVWVDQKATGSDHRPVWLKLR